jgi:hypothetical protein
MVIKVQNLKTINEERLHAGLPPLRDLEELEGVNRTCAGSVLKYLGASIRIIISMRLVLKSLRP